MGCSSSSPAVDGGGSQFSDVGERTAEEEESTSLPPLEREGELHDGQRVMVGGKYGTVRFAGTVDHSKRGGIMYGIELDAPGSTNANDGEVRVVCTGCMYLYYV